MGIDNIHILITPDPPYREDSVTQVLAVQFLLAEAHRRGEHRPGSMRRDCPLCQLGK